MRWCGMLRPNSLPVIFPYCNHSELFAERDGMKEFFKLVPPVISGFAAVAALHVAVPQSFALLQPDESHIFDNSRHIEVEIPAAQPEDL